MSKKFNGSNQIRSSLEIFNEKSIYNNDDLLLGFSEKYANFVFFNLYEFQLYGKVGRLPVPISLRRTSLGYDTLKTVTTGGTLPVQLVNFVADAYEDFRNAFKKKETKGELVENEAFLSSIIAHKGYTSPAKLYSIHRQSLYNAISQHVAQDSKKIKNFEDFMNIVENLIFEFAKKIPFTRSGFIKSRFCPPLVSGLVVEISNLKYDDDQKKYDAFLSSPNFEYYLNNALNHGFYVDAGAPWRMIADLSSPVMAQYMAKYGITQKDTSLRTNNVLTSYYDITSPTDFLQLRRTLMGMYNSFVAANEYDIESYVCTNRETMLRAIDRKQITIDTLHKTHPATYWLWLYLRIRNIESYEPLNESRLYNLYNKFVKMLDRTSIRDILLLMEIAISDVSDEPGSYHNLTKSLTREEKFEIEKAVARGSRDISSY